MGKKSKWFDITLFRHFAFDNVILILLFFIKAWNSILFVSIKYVYTVYVYIYIYIPNHMYNLLKTDVICNKIKTHDCNKGYLLIYSKEQIFKW